MAAMDHAKHDGICIWCHDRWPCSTALIRRELADHIRASMPQPSGDSAYNNTWLAAHDSAANLIDAP
jgi:hypothetical protein